ncbi:MAG: hypothetical protein M0R03_17410 [Novosphingobium sp.]|nr:hypothetical protein [Novosphingobium sp.]
MINNNIVVVVIVHGLLGFSGDQLIEITDLLNDPLKVSHYIHNKSSIHLGKYGKYAFKWYDETLHISFAMDMSHPSLHEVN